MIATALPPRPTIHAIITAVATERGLDPARLYRNNSRTAAIATARDEAIRRTYAQCGMSLPEIAAALGLRSHSSVHDAIRRAELRLAVAGGVA